MIVLSVSLIRPGRTVKAKNPDAVAGLPDFHARIEYSHQGYVVIGTFTDFPADIRDIRPLYSLDGKTWKVCGNNWDLHWLGNKEALTKLQNQTPEKLSGREIRPFLSEIASHHGKWGS